MPFFFFQKNFTDSFFESDVDFEENDKFFQGQKYQIENKKAFSDYSANSGKRYLEEINWGELVKVWW